MSFSPFTPNQVYLNLDDEHPAYIPLKELYDETNIVIRGQHAVKREGRRFLPHYKDAAEDQFTNNRFVQRTYENYKQRAGFDNSLKTSTTLFSSDLLRDDPIVSPPTSDPRFFQSFVPNTRPEEDDLPSIVGSLIRSVARVTIPNNRSFVYVDIPSGVFSETPRVQPIIVNAVDAYNWDTEVVGDEIALCATSIRETQLTRTLNTYSSEERWRILYLATLNQETLNLLWSVLNPEVEGEETVSPPTIPDADKDENGFAKVYMISTFRRSTPREKEEFERARSSRTTVTPPDAQDIVPGRKTYRSSKEDNHFTCLTTTIPIQRNGTINHIKGLFISEQGINAEPVESFYHAVKDKVIEKYQKSADLALGRKFQTSPITFATGFDEEDIQKEIPIGPDSTLFLDQGQTIQSISHGHGGLQSLTEAPKEVDEEIGKMMGMASTVPTTVAASAESIQLRLSSSNSRLKDNAKVFTRAMQRIFTFAAEWRNEDVNGLNFELSIESLTRLLDDSSTSDPTSPVSNPPVEDNNNAG